MSSSTHNSAPEPHAQPANRAEPENHAQEVERGERFEFGRNWSAFLSVLDDDRIQEAERSLREALDVTSLQGCHFLDAGCGSGLFSLAARRLGAQVHSFDFDPHSVACCRELKRRYFEHDDQWKIEEGSVLDTDFLDTLGKFDIVYSWGVLHHTGSMWNALDNVGRLVDDQGRLYIAIYNSQVYWTRMWTFLKRAYVRAPKPGKWLISGGFIAVQVVKGGIKDLVLLRNPAQRYHAKRRSRGMSRWHDWIDWIGGYPFETAKPDEIFDFYRQRGFRLAHLSTRGGGHGCNEFVLQRTSATPDAAPSNAAPSEARAVVDPPATT